MWCSSRFLFLCPCLLHISSLLLPGFLALSGSRPTSIISLYLLFVFLSLSDSLSFLFSLAFPLSLSLSSPSHSFSLSLLYSVISCFPLFLPGFLPCSFFSSFGFVWIFCCVFVIFLFCIPFLVDFSFSFSQFLSFQLSLSFCIFSSLFVCSNSNLAAGQPCQCLAGFRGERRPSQSAKVMAFSWRPFASHESTQMQPHAIKPAQAGERVIWTWAAALGALRPTSGLPKANCTAQDRTVQFITIALPERAGRSAKTTDCGAPDCFCWLLKRL